MRIRGSIVIAAVIALAAAGWILSGNLGGEPVTGSPAATDSARPQTSEQLPRVRVRAIRAEPYARVADVTGQTEASRDVTLRAQIDGEVASIDVPEGQVADVGVMVVRFHQGDLPARTEAAEALVRQRELEFAASERLEEQGYRGTIRLATARSALQQARATLETLRTTGSRMGVRMPFAGLVNTHYTERGDFVRKGDRIAHVIDLDPLVLSGHVSQKDRQYLAKGEIASALLVDGTVLSGQIRHVSAVADKGTRTFRVEVEIPNPDGLIVEGLTAQLSLPLQEVSAHRISGDIFTLGPEGRLGVKTIDGDDIVRFMPVAVVGGSDDQTFVTGLPEVVRVIVVGHEFVRDGARAQPVEVASGS